MKYAVTLKELDNYFHGVRIGTILPIYKIKDEDVKLLLPNVDVNILKCKISDIKPIEIGAEFKLNGETLIYQGEHRFKNSNGKEVLISNIEVFE